MRRCIVDLARDLAPAAVIGLLIGAWTLVGLWMCVVPVSVWGVVGTGAGCAFAGALLLDVFRGNV